MSFGAIRVVPGRGSSESIASRAPSDDADPVEEREGLQNRLRRKLLSEKHLRCPPCSTRKGEDSFALRRNSGDSGCNAEPRLCTSAGEARVQSGLVLPTKGRVPQSELSSSLALCAAPHPVILLRSEEPGSVQRYGRLQSRGTALWWSKERQIERQADVRCALHQLRSRIYSTQRSDPGSRSSARVVQPTVCLPTTVFSAQRFISLHNMAIRYWDDGRPALAFRHARLARDLLKAHGLPFGCVGHLMKAMKDLQRPYAAVERRIHAAAKAKNSSVRAHFDLAQLFFAKRMLGSAGGWSRRNVCMSSSWVPCRRVNLS
ncbi:hypothetical protein TGRUB_235870 [Toxoplasma gondii RUB]|nr:hypothetical protein TGRUB_235870 [Toxoplasma gondii RUB]